MTNIWYVSVLPMLPVLLARLAGIVVAIILLVRRRTTSAILALIGFGVLFVVSLAGLGRNPLVGLLVRRGGVGQRQLPIVSTGLGCCCSILDLVAIVCLIVALWQASSAMGDGHGGEEEVVAGEFVEISETAEGE